MYSTICVTNQKGGVGKTTTAGAILDWLGREGVPAVGVDMDTQGNLGAMHPDAPRLGWAHDLARGDVGEPVPGGIYASDSEGLVRLRNDLTDGKVRASAMLNALGAIDAVRVVDTPPATDALNLVSLIASDWVVIPMAPELFAVTGIRDELSLIREASDASGRSWDGRVGVLFTGYFAQTSLHRQMADEVEKSLANMGVHVFRQRIRHGIAIPEAQALGKTIFDHPGIDRGPVAQYSYFCEELADWVGIDREGVSVDG